MILEIISHYLIDIKKNICYIPTNCLKGSFFMPRHPREAEVRSHLSPGILRTVDRQGLRYDEMQPGQSIAVHAQDAITHKPSSFLLRVVSVRGGGVSGETDVTLQYEEGDFGFYEQTSSGTKKPTKLKPGSMMESGVCAALVPQTDYRMVYLGGIGVGRDQSFEFVEGGDMAVGAHNVTMLEVGDPAPDYSPPDISDHLSRVQIAQARRNQDQAAQEDMARRIAMEDLVRDFGDYPDIDAMKTLITGYSPNGQIYMTSFLTYGKEDGVADAAWVVLQRWHDEFFSFEHPAIRGDINFKDTSRRAFEQMIQEAGIQWPRPEEKITEIVVPEDSDRTARLTRKAGEYKQRGEDSDSLHKLSVLEEALATGTVSVEELRGRLKEKSWFSEDDFDRAVKVISDYCRTGGENIGGGTGLH